MQCPSCNHFAAYDTSAEPELDLDVENGQITGTARIVLTSECCGDELKAADFDVEIDLQVELESEIRIALELADDAEIDWDEWELELENESAELTDNRQTTSLRVRKDGSTVVKPIPFRYQKQFYGVHVDAGIKATKGDTVVTVSGTFEDEVQASDMEELV